jgi:dolichyl-phosphate beta-glucosyltransferase
MTQPAESANSSATIVVVPCFNEATRLDVAAFRQFLQASQDISLLFVDDGSTDDTPLVIEQLRQQHPKKICILRLSANAGKGEAVRRGIQAALRRRPALVGYWDADLATPLEMISRFQRVLLGRPELQLVMGARVALLGRQIERRWVRHLLGRAFATAASLVLGISVYDTQCGAKLFRVTPFTCKLFRQPFGTRWIFDVEILARVLAADAALKTSSAINSIYEYPLERWHDVQGSRLKLRDFVVAGLDLLRIRQQYKGQLWRRLQHGAIASIEHPASETDHREAA